MAFGGGGGDGEGRLSYGFEEPLDGDLELHSTWIIELGSEGLFKFAFDIDTGNRFELALPMISPRSALFCTILAIPRESNSVSSLNPGQRQPDCERRT